MQTTLVAFYRHKPAALTALLDACQRQVAVRLGDAFRPYALAQIHATLIGLEREESAPVPFANRNEHLLGGRLAAMDFDGLLDYLRHGPCPFRVQLGGFVDRDYAFTSRGQRPYQRAFSIQHDKVVLMGWPTLHGRPDVLDGLRRQAQAYNVRHSYHRTDDDVDNDLFMRIGMIDRPERLTDERREAACAALRDWLARRDPVEVEVTLADLSVVAYDSPELPADSTRAFALTDATLGGARLRALYG